MTSHLYSGSNEPYNETKWDGFANALNFWEVEKDIRHRILSSRKLGIFLDYDGTLTPIVSDPDKSFISDKMRTLIAKLSDQRKTDVAIVSGRCISKLQQFLKLNNLHLSGSHGAEILCPANSSNPNGRKMTFSDNLVELKKAEKEVLRKLIDWPGCHIEDNKFVFSVHYRNARFQQLPRRQKRAKQRELEEELRAIADRRNLRLEYGKKVYEIKPKGSWDKGAAVLWLIQQVLQVDCSPEKNIWEEWAEFKDAPHFENQDEEDSFDGDEVYNDLVKKYQESSQTGPPFYFFLGDDRSDERAFAALKANYPHQSLGILVSSKPRKTDASCWLKDPDEVYDFLTLLLKQSDDNVDPYIYNGNQCAGPTNNLFKVEVSSKTRIETPIGPEFSPNDSCHWSVN